jgi:hypothetical protein
MIAKTQRIRIGAGLTLCLSLLFLSAPALAETRSTLSVQVVLLPTCEVSARGDGAEIRCTGGGEEAAETTTTRTPSSPLARAEDALVETREDADEAGTTWVTVSY